MKLEELKKAVSDELSSRNLKNPKIRGNALIKVCDFIKKQSNKYIMTNGDLIFPSDKDILKKEYERYKGYNLNSAESSMNNISQEEISMKAIVPILYIYEIQHYR